MAKHPSVNRVKVTDVIQHYGATFFKAALARFVVQLKQPNLTGTQLNDAASGLFLGVSHVSAYHRINLPARISMGIAFLVVSTLPLYMYPTLSMWDHWTLLESTDTQVAQVRIVFTLSNKASEHLFQGVPTQDRPCVLAYIEWFTPFTVAQDPNHGLYKVSRSTVEGGRLASIIDVRRIL
ncbi:hypothetical protein FB446DRAFT_796109 [Lentinula raphanica]|nr:hypothetical protein FB446DRAFT_796109 [Lentinula raphanica]